MSERNGDRARFQKDRRRKLLRRQRIQALAATVRTKTDAAVGSAGVAVTDAASSVGSEPQDSKGDFSG